MKSSRKDDIIKVEKTRNLADALKQNESPERLMEHLNKVIPAKPELSPRKFTVPERPTNPTQEEVNNYRSASVFMQAIAEEALIWRDQLPANYKPAILAFLYGGIQIQVHALAQVSFHGIRLEGTLNGSPCSLLAHQSTVQILCFGEEETEEEPRRPIGFIWSDNTIEV